MEAPPKGRALHGRRILVGRRGSKLLLLGLMSELTDRRRRTRLQLPNDLVQHLQIEPREVSLVPKLLSLLVVALVLHCLLSKSKQQPIVSRRPHTALRSHLLVFRR